MTPQELFPYLSQLGERQLQLSLMLWGPPGIGKATLAFRFAPDRPLILRGDDGRCTTTIEPKPDAVYFGGLVTPEVAVLACR